MEKIKFSVLMSVYIKENPNYLDKALESVFFQTIIPNEVILIEDGKLTKSLDNVITKYKKQYPKIFKVLKYKKNRGLGMALRDGVINCSNEIIFRMDTDDICDKKRFEKQLKIFETNDVDVVGSNIVEYDENMKNITGYRKVPENDIDIKKMARTRNPMNHVTIAYKKNKVIKSGNYIDMPFFEDYYLWVRMFTNKCKFYNIQENLVKVRGGDTMIKRRGGLKYIKQILKFQKKLLKLGIIEKKIFILNFFVRSVVSLMPSKLRAIFYKKNLRK